MSFVHEDPDFDALVRIVADKRGLSLALVEKDYWVAHTLWALIDGGFEIWLKGGTSLSMGFSLRSLAIDMEDKRQIVGLPAFDDAAFAIPATPRGDAIRDAFNAIAPMFWEPRIPLEDACFAISEWVRRSIA